MKFIGDMLGIIVFVALLTASCAEDGLVWRYNDDCYQFEMKKSIKLEQKDPMFCKVVMEK